MPAHSPCLLKVEQLACEIGYRRLFEGLSFELQTGQWASLRGPNGVGKSTLMRCLAGLGHPASGRFETQGSVLFQSHLSGWKDSFTPSENLDWQAALDRAQHGPGTNIAAHSSSSRLGIQSALEAVGLSAQANLSFFRLSAGQKRRLSMARLLLSQQSLWLLDEPLTALDQAGQLLFVSILKAHLQKGGAALIATHQELPGLPSNLGIQLGIQGNGAA